MKYLIIYNLFFVQSHISPELNCMVLSCEINLHIFQSFKNHPSHLGSSKRASESEWEREKNWWWKIHAHTDKHFEKSRRQHSFLCSGNTEEKFFSSAHILFLFDLPPYPIAFHHFFTLIAFICHSHCELS